VVFLGHLLMMPCEGEAVKKAFSPLAYQDDAEFLTFSLISHFPPPNLSPFAPNFSPLKAQ
jgi:hypothetical protein